MIGTSKRETARPPLHKNGGDSMTILEVLALLELLAVVIFGILDLVKKKK